MQLKNSVKLAMFIGGSGGVVFSAILFFIFNFPVQSSYAKLIPPPSLPTSSQTLQNLIVDKSMGLPIRLKIPKIKVDATVEYVGIAPDGSMDVPKNPADVAWFNLGQRPGENGNAVIVGHYGRKNNKGSVFDNLHKLRQGDKLYIEDENGEIITFVVREIRRYDPKADTADIFISNDGKAHLNLITCEGDWDKVSKSYSSRLVVFADRE